MSALRPAVRYFRQRPWKPPGAWGAPGSLSPVRWTGTLSLPALLAALLIAVLVPAGSAAQPPAPSITVPHVERAPTLEDFDGMAPNGEMGGRLAKVEGFVQREPSDGKPASQRSEAYLGYDDKNLYVIFVCFDREPEKIRARMTARERVGGDDLVEVWLDTFADQRRGYVFVVNPFGVQWDGLFSEAQQFDDSFDTLWHSRGRLTDQGFIVWMAIPFKSLRFSAAPQQTWGVLLNRIIPRASESSFWPYVSSRVEGFLNQTARLEGLENISPGRNVQLIPYAAFRSFRALDTRDPAQPRFERDRGQGDAGLDAKFVLRDSFVLDVTLNPDFAQVESDEPQITVNQRFEVFFPEKRPFFLENASFFQTPINLLFTRRISDPQFGVRLTGKQGPWAVGAFLIDDQAPGKRRPPGDPLHGKRALFGIVRVNRDIFRESSLGVIYTDREFEQSYNRIAGLDARLKLSQNWVANLQGVTSWTQTLAGESLAGPAYDFEIFRGGRSFTYRFEYNDRGHEFRTEPGFLLRPDIRRYSHFARYRFWPERRGLLNWGPRINWTRVHDHSGTRLDWEMNAALDAQFTGQTSLTLFLNAGRERLRGFSADFPGLTQPLDFARPGYGFDFASSFFRAVTVSATAGWGKGFNFAPPTEPSVPPERRVPFAADETSAQFGLTLRPLTPLRIDNTYIFFRLKDQAGGANIFNNHILRSKWNYQFNRELSLRVILQYDATLANEPEFTSLATRKNFNADFLVTYLLHPGTALFVGYNGNAQNLDLVPGAGGPEIVRFRDRFINDAKQFFIKFSYLYRF